MIDILPAVEEFYALEAVLAQVYCERKLEPFRHSHARWERDFSSFREQYNSRLATAIYDYTAVTVAGEMRHGYVRASKYILGYFDDETSRTSVYRECIKYTPDSLLSAGSRLFGEIIEWHRSYGGPKWEVIARAGLRKASLPDSVFIDHCVDLSHNGSVYFDKGADIFFINGFDTYKKYLDFKRQCEPRQLMEYVLGSRFNRLILRAITLGIIDIPIPQKADSENCGLPLFWRHNNSTVNETESNILNYQSPQWGHTPLPFLLSGTQIVKQDERYWRGRDEDERTASREERNTFEIFVNRKAERLKAA